MSSIDSDPNVETRFMTTVNEMLDDIASMTADLYEDELVPFNEGAVELISAFLSTQSPDVLMWCLATTHKDWHMIQDRNEKYVLEIFPNALKSKALPIDTRVLTSPFTVFRSLEASEEWKNIDTSRWPVASKDLELIWTYIQTLIVMVCKKVYSDRITSSVDGKRVLQDPVYEAIDLNKWREVFNIKYA